ncbi:MAG TPA: tRNA (guanosine(37)-N1)-methyltransferase TrmD [Rhizomicrobium sp.]|jgi:tRNA (guanine37-N1)-methyltransferase|nr:tRNA (guanosine(37)-N1)-methyltransferase TrmD [Rhizomicrobium sp.]
MTWRATVLTLFPEMFPGPLGISLLGKALKQELWSLDVRDIREHGLGKHRVVDDTPSGGGPGMVMRADVASAAIAAARDANPTAPAIYLSPRGAPLTQAKVRALRDAPGAILLCGRFEGLDQRAIDVNELEEISLGDFVLAGGELAAMALIEATVRLIPGVLGADASPQEESFENGLLEYPQYTRPQEFDGRAIPDVLTGGNHKEIAKWRRAQAEAVTRTRRPDLWTAYEAKKLK